MNASSLTHSYVQMQQDTSTIGVDRQYVNGMANMTHKKNIANYAESLVYDYATHNGYTYTLTLDDLPTDEQGELARLYLETNNRDTSECVYGDDVAIDNDYTCALLTLLKDDTQENRERFAEITRNNVIKYFHNTLQAIIDDSCNDRLHAENSERGLYIYHRSNGDIYWRSK